MTTTEQRYRQAWFGKAERQGQGAREKYEALFREQEIPASFFEHQGRPIHEVTINGIYFSPLDVAALRDSQDPQGVANARHDSCTENRHNI